MVPMIDSYRQQAAGNLRTHIGRALQAGLMVLLALSAPSALAMSEKKEIELGQKEHQKVIAQFGIYKDAELASYIDRIGQKIAAGSSRPPSATLWTSAPAPWPPPMPPASCSCRSTR